MNREQTAASAKTFKPMLMFLYEKLAEILGNFDRPEPDLAFFIVKGPITSELQCLRESLQSLRDQLGTGDFLVGPATDPDDGSTVWILEREPAISLYRRMVGEEAELLGTIYPSEKPCFFLDMESEAIYHFTLTVAGPSDLN